MDDDRDENPESAEEEGCVEEKHFWELISHE
jgi:hypothetical protein